MKDIAQSLLIGLVIVAIAIFAITFYYSIFAILFILLSVTIGYGVIFAKNEIKKEKNKNP